MTGHPADPAIAKFQAAHRVLITSHAGLDGDSAGGALALLEVCRRLGKVAAYVNEEPLPRDLAAIPGIEQLGQPVPVGEAWDLGVIIDTSQSSRVGEATWPLFEKLDRICVDHHEGNGGVAQTAWVDSSAASVTVMLAEFFERAGVAIDLPVAFPLYLGLFTDTLSFRQSNTDPRALTWGARFVAAGVKPFDLIGLLWENRRLSAVRLEGLAASRVEVRGPVAWSWLARADFAALGADESDTEGIIGTIRCVGGVRAAFLMRELPDGRIRCNFRAKGDADVRGVAAEFGGGGHRAAAGCTVAGPLDAARDLVLGRLVEALQK